MKKNTGWRHNKDYHDKSGKAIRHSQSSQGIKNKEVTNIHKNIPEQYISAKEIMDRNKNQDKYPFYEPYEPKTLEEDWDATSLEIKERFLFELMKGIKDDAETRELAKRLAQKKFLDLDWRFRTSIAQIINTISNMEVLEKDGMIKIRIKGSDKDSIVHIKKGDKEIDIVDKEQLDSDSAKLKKDKKYYKDTDEDER